MTTFRIDVSLSQSYFKKLGLDGKGYSAPLNRAVDHTLSDAENTMKIEAPVDTGNLRQSIHKQKKADVSGEILSTGAPYWVYLENGTYKMPANPFVTRTANTIAPKFKQYFEDELRSEGII